MNYASDAKVNKPSLKSTGSASVPASKTISTVNVAAKERSEFSNMDLVTTSLSRTSFDTRFHGANVENEKSVAQKKNSNFKLGMNEKSVKKESSTASKTPSSREVKSAFKYPGKVIDHQNKSEKSANKININAKSQEKTESVVPKISSLSKNVVENVKSSSNIAQSSHGRIRSKTKAKPKKPATTKSEIFNTDKELSDSSFVVRDGDLDLADLIEASLKNIRSPRSIFNHNFSCVQQSDARKNPMKSRNEIQDIDRLKQLKPMRSSIVTNYLSDRMARGNEILEKLSEKSEPFSGTSCESLVNDKKALSGGDNGSLSWSEKYMKARAELEKSLDWRSGTIRSDPVASENQWDSSSTASLRNKLQSPGKIESGNDKPLIARGSIPLKTSLKMYGLKGSENRKDVPARSSESIIKTRTESESNSNRVEKRRLSKRIVERN